MHEKVLKYKNALNYPVGYYWIAEFKKTLVSWRSGTYSEIVNRMPCANGNWLPQLIVLVCRRM